MGVVNFLRHREVHGRAPVHAVFGDGVLNLDGLELLLNELLSKLGGALPFLGDAGSLFICLERTLLLAAALHPFVMRLLLS